MKIVSLLLPLGMLLGAVTACEARTPQVVNQEVSVRLEPAQHELSGSSSVRFAAGTGAVEFRLSQGAEIRAVTCAGRPLPYRFTGGVLTAELPKSGAEPTLTIVYRARFNDPVADSPGASEDPSYGVSGTITGQGTFLGDSADWYPVPAQVPTRRTLTVTAPAGTEAVSFGRRVTRETRDGITRSTWQESHPVGALSLCAGPYRVEDRTVDGIELHSYLYPENAALSGRYLDAAERYLRFYSGLFGPYPFEKFAVVENFFQTGYGFPSFTLLGGAVLRLPFIIDTSFPHEIAHSWWGNAISIAPGSGNWCEGLVTYLADYYLKERRSAAEARDYREQLLIDFASLVSGDNDFPLTRFERRSDPSSRAIGYGKAAFVFHMMRSRIGDEAFFAGLRQVVRAHLYDSASWNDFADAFSKSSGKDQHAFLEQWLTRPGGPRLRLVEVVNRREKEGWSVAGRVVQDGADYPLDVPLRLEGEAGNVETRLALAGRSTPFRLVSKGEPRRVVLDPDAEVFRILTQEEIPATVNSVKGSRQLLGVRTANCRAGAQGFSDLLASFSQPGTQVVSEEEFNQGQFGDRDLVFCGVPRTRESLPRLPDGVQVDREGFTVAGEGYTGTDASLFLVLSRPGAAGRVSALYQPLSEAAAAQYGLKITHYGKYAELVFARGANRIKARLAVPESAAAVLFKR
ncbi:peptidase M1 [Geomonas limicola]|uniref:Peptidase M1 n=1 Tax=Geomonas limicola TaxID=2740186 RepID=A0A6V8N3Y0_9BACT|nr:M1 family aminopeptidase [Geomonas limicola]GFO66577.1 peptidase M1 [Geomonas limicola]